MQYSSPQDKRRLLPASVAAFMVPAFMVPAFMVGAYVAGLGFTAPLLAQDRGINVVVWDERQPAQKKAYPEYLGQYVADYLKRQPNLQVRSVNIDDPEKGLSAEVLDSCDVLIWWGHVRNGEISEEDSERVVSRLREGKLSLLALHSAHWATPFVMAMHERAKTDALGSLDEESRKKATVEFTGKIIRRPPPRELRLSPRPTFQWQSDGSVKIQITRPNCCFPAYRNDGLPSRIRVLAPQHPIAKGIPADFELPHTEMYDEPFHVPEPDLVIFEERWEKGEHFRSGMFWKVGEGEVFYFRPGHETFAVYTEPVPMQILDNAVRYLGRDK
jgi:trehalose utilization protein